MHSRGMFCRILLESFTLFEPRAQGRPGARCTRGLACQLQEGVDARVSPGMTTNDVARTCATPSFASEEDAKGFAARSGDIVIARSEATKQSRLFPRRHSGLLRFARNDARVAKPAHFLI